MSFTNLRLDAVRVYLLMGGITNFAFGMIFTVLAVYYVQTVGMNPLQLVLVGTTIELTILLFEIPTGIVADLTSRRLSVILGYALIGLCYIGQGLVPIFVAILIAEVVRGVGETFISGAASAWIADEVGEGRVGPIYLRYGQVAQIGAFVGIGAGTALALLGLYVPVLLGGGLLVATSLLLVLVMPETGFKPTPRPAGEGPLHAMRDIATTGVGVVRRRPVVLMLVLVGIVYGAFSEGMDRLWEAHFLLSFSFPAWQSLPPVVWIGLLNAVSMLLGLVANEVIIRRWEAHGVQRLGPLLLALTAGLLVAVVGFGLAPTFGVAVAAFLAASVFRTLQGPIAQTWLNRDLPSQVRATVLSLVGQADAVGQLAGGPVVGWVGLRSLRAALVFSGLILSPALALYARGLHLENGDAPDQPAPESDS